MGCSCSDPKKKEEDPLLKEAETKTRTQNTQQRSNDHSGECDEKGPNKRSTELEEKGSNGYHPTSIANEWYVEREEKTSGNILETLCSIIGDKHKNDIQNAIKSVKIKDNLNEVCQYLLHKANVNETKTFTDEGKHECKDSVDECGSMTRIITVFEAYIKWIKSAESGKTKDSFYAIVEDKLPKQINSLQILNDYHHLMLNHNTDKAFERIYDILLHKELIISIDKSSIILRNYRDRSVMIKKERERLYFGSNETNEIALIKLIDRIYCFFVYSFDIGMRLRMKEKLNIVYTDEANDGRLVCISSMIKKKQINLINIMEKNRSKVHKFASIHADQDAVVYYYKPEDAESNESIQVFGGEYKRKDWFIKAKHDSLKDELIHNDKCRINKTEFDDLMVLAMLYIKSDYNQSINMEQEHVLALMLYSNYALVEYELKESYFRLNDTEKDFTLKKRHSLLGNLGRLLQDVVYKYGIECDGVSVYHSMELDAVNTTLIKYIAPTSVSPLQLVVYNYTSITHAQSGVMIELNIKDCANKYVNCSFLSDFANECEYLFVSGNESAAYPLELLCVFDVIKPESYAFYVSVLSIICIAFGEVNEEWNESKLNPFKSRWDKELKKVSTKVLEQRAVQVQPHLFGNKSKKKKNKSEYNILSQFLEQFAVSKKEIYIFWFSSKTIEVWPWIDELLLFMQNSCFCKNLNQRKWLKLDLFALFFVECECVTIVDCKISEDILNDIDLFVQKLKSDPSQKHKKLKSDPPAQMQRLESDVLDMVDISGLVDQLHSEKSHISFNDPKFDDFCDYRQCAIKEIRILESYDPSKQQDSILNQQKIMRKFVRRYKKYGWNLKKTKIMGNNDGFTFKKI